MSQGKAPRQYTREFKIEAVQLSLQPGMRVKQVAADLGIPPHALYRWRCEMQLSESEAFRGHGRRTAAEDELARLRRENAELKMERDILKKATAFFAKHQR
jgi:transposase-like protein